jgi:predicted peptidase
MLAYQNVCRSLVLLALVASCAPAADPNDFVDFSLPRPAGGNPLLPGRLYTPPEASSGPRPLILFLHGAGEAGVNNTAQVNGNIDNLLAEARRRGAFLYAPQSTGNWSGRGLTDNVMTMIDRALLNYAVDADRIYVTGLSNGGGGTWNMLSRYGERFAAGIPICGVAPPGDYLATNLIDEPFWAFHARNDGTVSVTNSRNRVNDVLNVVGETAPTYPAANVRTDFEFEAVSLDLRYTEYYTGGHGIWGRVYNTPEMYDWLFAHTSAVPEPNSLSLAIVGSWLFLLRRNRRNRLGRRRVGGTLTRSVAFRCQLSVRPVRRNLVSRNGSFGVENFALASPCV